MKPKQWTIFLVVTLGDPNRLLAPYWFKDRDKARKFMVKLSEVYPETPPCQVEEIILWYPPEEFNLYWKGGTIVPDLLSEDDRIDIRNYIRRGWHRQVDIIKNNHKRQLQEGSTRLYPM